MLLNMTTMPPIRDHAYYSVGEHKGNNRIWLQGTNLVRSNFSKGVDYEVIQEPESNALLLRLINVASKGTRIVSGKKKSNLPDISPIIDLANSSITQFVGTATKVRADFANGYIRISIFHLDMSIYHREQSLLNNLRQGFITKGVLCCGIGVSAAASDEAFVEAGIEPRTEFVIDREPRYLEAFTQNNPAYKTTTVTIEGLLEDVEPSLLSCINMLIFSLGCTGHSKSGKAKNNNKHAEDHKTDATAILGLIRIIDQLKPAILASENVVEAKDSATYSLLKGILVACGYVISEIVLSTKDTGTVEDRHRWWFVATSKGLPTVDLSQFPEFESQYKTFADVKEDVPLDSPTWKSEKVKLDRAAANKAKGKNFGFTVIKDTDTNIKVCGRGYQKDRNSEPHVSDGNGRVRLLTTTELANAQNVPVALIKDITPGTAYEGLGQGVDYFQAKGISQRLIEDVLLKFTSPGR
jgi:DNA (cytosine-5)-methyltransferase 1